MDELAQAVRERAEHACEYCLLPEQHHPGEFFVEAVVFEIEHIIPRQHRGRTVLRNLAFSCLRCNKSKGPNLAGLDLHTGKLTPLFHPRRHKWPYHFRLDGPYIVGRTPIGRVTVYVLNMNHPLRVELRRQLIEEGTFSPQVRGRN
jgi:HNH endonuclease